MQMRDKISLVDEKKKDCRLGCACITRIDTSKRHIYARNLRDLQIYSYYTIRTKKYKKN